MAAATFLPRTQFEGLSDEEIVARVIAGETALYEIIMRRYNQRLYRVARSILRDDAEAEDVMQDAYVRAYQHLRQFEGRARFSTWLTRIAVHEALARLRRHHRHDSIDELVAEGNSMSELSSRGLDPERHASHAEVKRLLESAVLELPAAYRTVVVLRDVEEMTTLDTAAALGLTEENVKVRLHRARAMLRRALFNRVGATSAAAFQFEAPRCDRVVRHVLVRIAELAG